MPCVPGRVAGPGPGWQATAHMKREQYEGIVRHLLGAAGGIAVGCGVLDESMMLQATGALATLAAVLWSIWEKRQAR